MLTHDIRETVERVRIVEVGPRDGLQNVAIKMSVEERVRLITRLVATGHRDVEVGSFVHPRWIPQMANTGEVLSRLERRDDVRYWALVPNMRGLENALSVGAKHVAVFLSSSETHNQNNLNRSIAESLENIRRVSEICVSEGVMLRGYISTVFGCPYEGEVDFERVVDIGSALLEMGCDHLSLGDTTGMGEPKAIESKLERALSHFGAEKIALHSHDTRGLGLVNTLIALRVGLRIFDSSVGGMGGCPYAAGAAGNLATEDLVYFLNSMGIEHGLDLGALVEISRELKEKHTITISSHYFPYGVQSLLQRT